MLEYLKIQVYLPAIAGHVPSQMVCAIMGFLDFCYLVCHEVITEDTLDQISTALTQFHENRVIFCNSGVRPTGFLLPRQHSLMHYRHSIQLFAAPNGLCSSITESKHIKAVKEPWRHSNHFDALGQMLLTNQRLDKLAASQADFKARGMLNGPCLSSHIMALQAAPPPAVLEQQPELELDDGNDGSGEFVSPQILNHMLLSRNPGLYSSLLLFHRLIIISTWISSFHCSSLNKAWKARPI
jgi:hypothetical protein